MTDLLGPNLALSLMICYQLAPRLRKIAFFAYLEQNKNIERKVGRFHHIINKNWKASATGAPGEKNFLLETVLPQCFKFKHMHSSVKYQISITLLLEICRICQEPETELFTPCLCSGSIRYVCKKCIFKEIYSLKKSTCSICAHEYTIRVYRRSMPENLSALDIIEGFYTFSVFKW